MVIKRAIYTIAWSPRALKDYYTIIDIIGEKFGDAAIQKFVRRTMAVLEHVSFNPEIFRPSEKNKNKHIALITKQTTLYFRVKPKKKDVELLLFWDTRRNPKTLKY